MRDTISLGPFGGVFKNQAIGVPEGFATSMLNARVVVDGVITPRFGFRTISARPAAVTAFVPRGITFLQGYNPTTFAGIQECITIEKRDGVVKPYVVDLSTGVRAVITNAGNALSLADGEYLGFAYNDRSYFVNPTSTVPLYRHLLGNNDSFVGLVDTAYVAPPADPTLTLINAVPAQVKGHSATDVVTFPVAVKSHTAVTPAYNADGSMTLSGSDNDDGVVGTLQVQEVFAANVDFLNGNYFHWTVTALSDINFFTATTLKVELLLATVWTEVTTKCYVSPDKKEATFRIHTKGVTISAVQGIRYTLQYKPTRSTQAPASQPMCRVSPYMGGGVYLESADVSHLIWDATLDGDGVSFGARYTDGGAVVSAIVSQSLTADQARGYSINDYAGKAGAFITLSVPDPVAPYTTVQFLRLDTSTNPPKWKLINTDTTTPFTYIETNLEYEAAWKVTDIATGTSPGVQPPFSTRGLVGGFGYRGRIVWLRKGGLRNVSHSRATDAEETFDVTSPYDIQDDGRPVDFDLAQDLTDEPVGGLDVGNGLIIVGKNAAYSQLGVYPKDMTTPQRIPGSVGVAGRFAFSHCVYSGVPGLAYADLTGKVWFVTVGSAYEKDASVNPVDLTAALGYWLKTFLFDEQKAEFGFTDLSGVRMQWDQFQQSLWVMMGKRAVVLRPGNPPAWEPYEYQLTNPGGVSTVSACTDFSSNMGVAANFNDGFTDWSLVNYAFTSDDSRATCGTLPAGTGVKTDILRITGLTPGSPLSVDAVVTKLKYRVERSKIGDLVLTETKVQPRKSGADMGADMQIAAALTTSDVITTFERTTGLPTVAEINAGALGLDLQYTQADSNADWTNPAKYTIGIGGSDPAPDIGANSQQSIKTITVTYIGALPKPPSAKISVTATGTVTMVLLVTPFVGDLDNGTGRITNGMSADVTETILSPSHTTVTATGVEERTVALTAGVGTLVLTSDAVTTHTNGSQGTSMTFPVSAVFVVPTLDTARVDNVDLSVCYDLTTASPESTTGIGWDYLFFTPNRNALAFRHSGQVDEIEWDTSIKAYIDGTGRDGGRAMPDGYRFVQINTHERTRVAHIEVDQYGSHDISCDVDGTVVAVPSGTRWAKFPYTLQGVRQEIGVRFSEAIVGVRSMRVDFDMLSKRYKS